MIVVGMVPPGVLYASRGSLIVTIEHGAPCSSCGGKIAAGETAVFEWDGKRHRQPSRSTIEGAGTTGIRHKMCGQHKSDMPAANPPAQLHSETSVAAAATITSIAPTLRDRVERHLRVWPSTDEEGAAALAMELNTYRPRRIELVAMLRVRNSGRTRKTRSGSDATVWKIRED